MSPTSNPPSWCVLGTKSCYDISVLMMYTFYQSVYYASHNQSFPSANDEKHAFWVCFSEHVGDAITHKLLDSSSKQIIYGSAVHSPDDLHPNKHLLSDLGESEWSNKPTPLTFVKSHQNLDKPVSKPMAEYNPDDLTNKSYNDALIRVTRRTCNNQTETRSEQDVIVPSFPYR